MILNFWTIFSYIENDPEKIKKILQDILADRQFANLKQGQDDVFARFLKSLSDNKIISSILESVFKLLFFSSY